MAVIPSCSLQTASGGKNGRQILKIYFNIFKNSIYKYSKIQADVFSVHF